ncbi:hypothetical protein [Catenuloplanes atrovinosus]|uniref:Uncharacterized protein n=1 Tax=Catenuloplanes atrovinosus TaxID=137266 RepID=A0AAE4C8N9_9ACTN|nr:hypothetical protein [Catenuloplanes atrovinosus]MDR7275726.1 hypothetical protein [Catenuloplanes atrovinosus]
MSDENQTKSTVDRGTDLDELRNGGPTRTPGMMTTTGGTAGPASVAAAHARRRAAERAGEAREADEPDPREAHGGSMAPGLVDDTGNLVADPPPGTAGRA